MFTYDPTTSRGRVRLLLADTDTSESAKQVFSDAEIDAFLAIENGEIYAAAAAGAESIAADGGKQAIVWEALKTKLDMRDIPKYYLTLSKRWRDRATDDEPYEEADTLDYQISPYGRDQGEYVGDTIT